MGRPSTLPASAVPPSPSPVRSPHLLSHHADDCTVGKGQVRKLCWGNGADVAGVGHQGMGCGVDGHVYRGAEDADDPASSGVRRPWSRGRDSGWSDVSSVLSLCSETELMLCRLVFDVSGVEGGGGGADEGRRSSCSRSRTARRPRTSSSCAGSRDRTVE